MWALLAGLAGLPAGMAAAAQGDRVCVLELAGALPNDRTMAVHLDLRGGQVHAAFADARSFNRMPYEVDASDVKVAPAGLTGPIKVSIPTDGWVPKGVAKVDCRYELTVELAGGKASGKFAGQYGQTKRQGAVSGTVGPRPAEPKRCRFELGIRNPSRQPRAISSVNVVFGMRGGKVVGCKLVPVGSVVDIGPATRAGKADITFADGRLSGTVAGALGEEAEPFTVAFDAVVIGRAVAGRVTIRNGQEQSVGAAIQGTADFGDVPPAGDCLYKLTLHDGIAPGKMMNLYLSCRGGRFVGGFAAGPNYNNGTHEVDLSGLKLAGGKVAGEVKVTVFPDAWIPRDHKQQAARYTIQAAFDDADITGSYEGAFAGTPVRGDIEGQITPKPAPGRIVQMTFKAEGGLYNGSPSGYRAFFTMQVADGRIVGGHPWNNHDRNLKGTVEGGEIRIADETLTVTFTVNIQPGTSARPGKYVISARGPVVGELSCGPAESRWEGKTWTSRYWATWSTAAAGR